MANIAYRKPPLEIDKWTNADKATDGDVTNYDARNGFAYANNPADFTLDLGEEKLIYAIRVLLWDGEGVIKTKSKGDRRYRFEIGISTVNSNYTTVFSNREEQGDLGWFDIRLTGGARARYVQLNAISCTTQPDFHIVEFEVHDSVPDEIVWPNLTVRERLKRSKRLLIDLTSVYAVRIQDESEMQSEVFYKEYEKAFREIEEMCKRSSQWIKENSGKSDRELEINLHSTANNILAISGERGSGKTSMVMSIRKRLFGQGLLPSTDTKTSLFSNNSFCVLDLVDPSVYHPNDSIVSALVARFYKDFTTSRKPELKGGKELRDSKGLEELFLVVLRDLQTQQLQNGLGLGDPREPENPYSVLDRVSSTGSLRLNLYKLIDAFLDYRGRGEEFAVLTLDDLDLNMANGFALVEDIRKHLLIPNLIILVAIKLDQLRDAIEGQYIRLYESLAKPDTPVNQTILYEKIERISIDYLEKIFPSSRNIYLKGLNGREFMRGDYDLAIRSETKNTEDRVFHNIERELLSLISERTGVLFLYREEYIHPIIPSTIRQLQNLIKFIYTLDKATWKQSYFNLQQFRSYVFERFCEYLLDSPWQEKVKDIFDGSPYSRNKLIVQLYREYFQDINQFARQSESSDSRIQPNLAQWRTLVANETFAHKVWISDLIALHRLTERVHSSRSGRELNFIVSTLISIDLQLALLRSDYNIIQTWIGPGISSAPLTRLIGPRRGVTNMDWFSYSSDDLIKEIQSVVYPIKQWDSDKTRISEAIMFGSFVFIALNQDDTSKLTPDQNFHRNIYQGSPTSIQFSIMGLIYWILDPVESVRRFIDEIPTDNLNEKIVILAEETLGKQEKWRALFQTELLTYILDRSESAYDQYLNNRKIARSELKLFDEVKLFFGHLKLLLANLRDTGFKHESLDEIVNLPFWTQLEKSDSNKGLFKLLNSIDPRSSNSSDTVDSLRSSYNNQQLRNIIEQHILRIRRYRDEGVKRSDRSKHTVRAFRNQFESSLIGDEAVHLQEAIRFVEQDPRNLEKRKAMIEIAYNIANSLLQRTK